MVEISIYNEQSIKRQLWKESQGKQKRGRPKDIRTLNALNKILRKNGTIRSEPTKLVENRTETSMLRVRDITLNEPLHIKDRRSLLHKDWLHIKRETQQKF